MWDRRNAIGVPGEIAELCGPHTCELARSADLAARVLECQRGEKANCGSLPHL
jgi:hypothetical protein